MRERSAKRRSKSGFRANQKPIAKTSVDSRPANSANRLVPSIVVAAFMLSFLSARGAPPPRAALALRSRQKPRLGSLEQRNSPTQFLPAGGSPGRLLRARGPQPSLEASAGPPKFSLSGVSDEGGHPDGWDLSSARHF